MNKKSILILISGLALFSNAIHSSIATMSTNNTTRQYKMHLRINVNNKTINEIKTDSNIVPEEYKVIPAHSSVQFSSVQFSIEMPSDLVTQSFQYLHHNSGCKFKIEMQQRAANPFENKILIKGIPLGSNISCKVKEIEGIDNLSVSF